MKQFFVFVCVLFLTGCANNICEFGKGDSGQGFHCYLKQIDAAKIGMSQKDIEKTIGRPDERRFGISYMGKNYDEAWVYSKASPPTILYFSNGILKEKDYQQYQGRLQTQEPGMGYQNEWRP